MLVLTRRVHEGIEIQTPTDPAALAKLLGGELIATQAGGLAITLPEQLRPAVCRLEILENVKGKVRLGLRGDGFVIHRDEIAKRIRDGAAA